MRAIVLGQFLLLVVVLLALIMLQLFIGRSSGILIDLIGLPSLALSGLVVLLYSLWRPSRAKVVSSALVLLVGLLLLLMGPLAHRTGVALYFTTRQAALDGFVEEILLYERIHAMSDGGGSFRELNGELVADAPVGDSISDDQAIRSILPLEAVLDRDAVDPLRYREFRRRLADLGMIAFEVTPGYVAFLQDGMLDNLQGFLYRRSDTLAPAIGTYVFSSRIVVLNPLADGWHWFETT